MHPQQRLSILLAIFLLPVYQLRADEPDSSYLRNHYTKQEVLVPMRDGVKLFTSILLPKDSSERAPILLMRTPYSCAPYGPDAYPRFLGLQASRYARLGYILVRQDVRGRFMSEGEFVNVRPYSRVKQKPADVDETSDTYDTVDWLIRNLKHCNGNVGVFGTSYPGFYAWMSAIDAHPAVKAVSPQAPVSAWMLGDDFSHNGAFLLPHAFDFFSGFGKPRPKPTTIPAGGIRRVNPDGYTFFLDMGPLTNAKSKYLGDSITFWNQLTAHGTWDEFWAERNVLPHLRNLHPATMVVGGWFDTENLWGALHSYAAANAYSSGHHTLVMGPWSHGQWGGDGADSLGFIGWGANTSRYFVDSIEVPFFECYLRGRGSPHRWESAVFETGANVWHYLDRWPPQETEKISLYCEEKGKLRRTPPRTTGLAWDEYVNDPDNPVPYTSEIRHWYNPAFMVEDQRFASRRPDVLDYVSDVLVDDLDVAGPIEVDFHVSTTGTDCDWVVKLIDVFPDSLRTPRRARGWVTMGGYQMLVRGDVMRGKFRNSTAKPEPFIPGQPTALRFKLNDIFHRFAKGHRIMVQVQSSWFPMIDRNPGKFVDIFQAKEEDFQKTTQRVYRSATAASRILLPVVQRGDENRAPDQR